MLSPIMTSFRPGDKQMANSMSRFQAKTARNYTPRATILRYAPPPSPRLPPQRKCLTAWNLRLDVLTDEIITESEKRKKNWQPKYRNYNFSFTQDIRMNSIATHEATSRTCSRQYSGKAEALARRRDVENKDWDGTGSDRTNSDKTLNSFFIYVSAMHLCSFLYFFLICTCAKQETSHVISELPVKWQKSLAVNIEQTNFWSSMHWGTAFPPRERVSELN